MPGESGALVDHMLLERGHDLGTSHSRVEIVENNEHDVGFEGETSSALAMLARALTAASRRGVPNILAKGAF
jgi:hypothetical protein